MLYKFFWFSIILTVIYLILSFFFKISQLVIVLIIVDFMVLESLVYLRKKEEKTNAKSKLENIERICNEIIEHRKNFLKKEEREEEILKWLGYF